MTPRRILVTGASGFVAGHLVPRLRAAFPAAELILCGEGQVALDVTDAGAVEALVAARRPDAVVHLAAVSSVALARGNPATWAVNLSGTLHLAAAMRAHAPEGVLLFASSAEIYGASFRAGVPLDEGAAAAPQNTYAATKAAADLALGALAAEAGLRVIRLRPFNHTGVGQTDTFVVPGFARQVAAIAAGKAAPVIRVGNLEARRDFLDVRDVCDAYVAALARADGLAAGFVANIASGTARRVGDVLDDLIRLAGIAPAIEEDPARMRPSDIPFACGDASVARAALGWAPRVAWETTLGDVLGDWMGRV